MAEEAEEKRGRPFCTRGYSGGSGCTAEWHLEWHLWLKMPRESERVVWFHGGHRFLVWFLVLACAQCVCKPAIVWSNNRKIWIWMPTILSTE